MPLESRSGFTNVSLSSEYPPTPMDVSEYLWVPLSRLRRPFETSPPHISAMPSLPHLQKNFLSDSFPRLVTSVEQKGEPSRCQRPTTRRNASSPTVRDASMPPGRLANALPVM